jgi:hypothetical protein
MPSSSFSSSLDPLKACLNTADRGRLTERYNYYVDKLDCTAYVDPDAM